jgi:heme-degrading monooxygenase HmoA
MILEIAVLNVIEDKCKVFEADFKIAEQFISSSKGYIRHSLKKCLEKENQFLLSVEWETLEDHTIGFRRSPQYQEWKNLLHHYYEPFPKVEHYEDL